MKGAKELAEMLCCEVSHCVNVGAIVVSSADAQAIATHLDAKAANDSAVTGEVGEIQQRLDGRIWAGGGHEQVAKDLSALLAIVQRQAGEIAALKQEHFAATLAIEQTLHETEQRSDAARAEVERLKVRDAQTVADGLAVLNKLTDARCALQKMREALSQEESEHLAALADLDEARAKAAALAHENAVLINEVGNLDATAREQRQRAEVLVRGIAAYRTGSFTLAQVWENEEGKAVKR